jgi:SAM-dependent methyltransferase
MTESGIAATAPDGSPVELYARMPTFGEPELIHGAIPAGAEILELGSGAGRMTHRLLELGHPVTAVDSSAEMLAHVRGAQTVRSQIEGLDLGRRFACVLLASQLINDQDIERAAYLATCARHVARDGVVLIQRYDPAWATDPRPSDSERGGVRIRVVEPRRQGRLLTATVEYEADGRTWRQGPFTATIVEDDELAARLNVSGLRLERWLDDRRTWLAATPLPDTSAVYVEVPAAEPLVADHRLAYDPAAAAGIPAHVTILYPFLEPGEIDRAVRRRLREICAGVGPFDARFERVGRFPGVAWLAPEPIAPFRALTEAMVEAWPDHPPYGGEFEEVIHHLTLGDGSPDDILDTIAAQVAPRLPISQPVRELTLAARRSGTWSVVERYSLGTIAADA